MPGRRHSPSPSSGWVGTPNSKHSPNFSPTLTPPLTWAGGPRTGAGCPRPGTSTTRVAPGQVFPPSAMARSIAASRSGRASLPNPHRPRIGRSVQPGRSAAGDRCAVRCSPQGATARRSGADDLCSRSGAFRVFAGCARSASLKEWGRVKEMLGSVCRVAGVGGLCASVCRGRGRGQGWPQATPEGGLALAPASDDADSSSGPDGQHGAGVGLGWGCRTVVLTI
jgi:hypothetical protein